MSHYHHSQFGSFVPGFDANTIWFTDSFIPLEAIIPWEVWKPIPNCRWAEVSSFGQVRSFCTNRSGVKPKRLEIPVIMTQRLSQNNHMDIRLITNDGRRPTFSVNRLVLEAFSPQPDPSLSCRHIDGESSHNHIGNLRWGTHKENMRDKILHKKTNYGEKCHSSKLTAEKVLEIRRRLANGERIYLLAEEYGVSRPNISNIKNGKHWKHI